MGLIKRWVDYKGWKASMFAAKAGIKTGSVSYLLRKETLTHKESIAKYADVFGVSIDEFLAGPPPVLAEDRKEKYAQARGRQILESRGKDAEISSEGSGEEEREMSKSEIVGQIVCALCTLDDFRLTKILGQVEMMRDEMKEEKNISQVS